MTKRDFQSADLLQARLDAFRPFPPETLASLRDYYRVGLTWSSNALEGNTLTESETKVVIEDGLTVGGHPLREVYEAAGHAEAFDFIHGLVAKRPLAADDILALHRLFYQRIDSDNAGAWRKVRVFISGSRHPLPQSGDVPGLMTEFVDWMAKSEGTMHPVEFAARTHLRFVFIHPFVDGNGRVARLLMNLALLRVGWPMALVPPVLRAEYIEAIAGARRSPNTFIRFIRDRVIETQRDLLRLFEVKP